MIKMRELCILRKLPSVHDQQLLIINKILILPIIVGQLIMWIQNFRQIIFFFTKCFRFDSFDG